MSAEKHFFLLILFYVRLSKSPLPLDANRGVSPVVGVAILLAIVVILGAVLFAFVSDFNLNNTPEVAGVTFEENPDKGTITVDLINIQKDGTDHVILVGNGETLGTLNDVGDSADITPPSDGSQITIVAVDDEDGNPRTTVGDYDPSFGGTQVEFSQSDGDLNVTWVSARDSVDNITVERDEGGSTQTQTISNEGDTITISDSNISNETTVTVTEQPSDTVVTEYTYTTDESTESFSTAHTSAPDCSTVNYSDDDGDGYWDVDSDYKLQCINYHGLAKDYELTQNIDASGTSEWNGGSSARTNDGGDAAHAPADAKGFNSIGNYSNSEPFTGEFHGRGYAIKGLYINRTSQNGVGLFASVDSGSIENVELQNVDIKGDSLTGGLVGYQRATAAIKDSYAAGNVAGNSSVGLLVGRSVGSIDNSYATGDVFASSSVGGLVGRSDGNVDNSYATAAVTSTDGFDANTGGLVGFNKGNIDSSYATGDVNSTAYYNANTGGLVGKSIGSIDNSYATGDVSGDYAAGGLVGRSDGDNTAGNNIDNSYATGDVTGNKGVGGLIGRSYNADVYNSYATGNVTSAYELKDDAALGGVVGRIYEGGNYSNVSTSSRVEVVEYGAFVSVGGFVGRSENAVINNSSATGSVTSNSSFNGGFVGLESSPNSTYDNSYANVTINSNEGSVGGFVGQLGDGSPSINNSYAIVIINAGDGADSVGGFHGQVGYDAAPSLRNVYAVGEINGNVSSGGLGGGERSTASPSYTDAYWDTDVASGQSSDLSSGNKSGITALSSSEMKGSSAESNMDFDFSNEWDTTNSYPRIQGIIAVTSTDVSISEETTPNGNETTSSNETYEVTVSYLGGADKVVAEAGDQPHSSIEFTSTGTKSIELDQSKADALHVYAVQNDGERQLIEKDAWKEEHDCGSAARLVVDGDSDTNDEDYDKIATAVSEAESRTNCNIIYIRDSTYTPSSTINVNDSITITGQSRSDVVITGADTIDGPIFNTKNDSSPTIEKITFHDIPSSAVNSESGKPTIQHVTVDGTTQNGYNSLNINGVTSLTLRDIKTTRSTGGIYINPADNNGKVVIEDSNIKTNNYVGITLYGGRSQSLSTVEIRDTRLDARDATSTYSGNIYVGDLGANVTIDNATVIGSGGDYGGQLTFFNNEDVSVNDVHLRDSDGRAVYIGDYDGVGTYTFDGVNIDNAGVGIRHNGYDDLTIKNSRINAKKGLDNGFSSPPYITVEDTVMNVDSVGVRYSAASGFKATNLTINGASDSGFFVPSDGGDGPVDITQSSFNDNNIGVDAQQDSGRYIVSVEADFDNNTVDCRGNVTCS